MKTDRWYSSPTQVYWTCKSLTQGQTISTRTEIHEVGGWRLGAIIHTLKSRYGWPILVEYRGPENVAHYYLAPGTDLSRLRYPSSARGGWPRKAVQHEAPANPAPAPRLWPDPAQAALLAALVYGEGAMTDARQLVAALGGKWHGSYGNAPCPSASPSGGAGRMLCPCAMLAGGSWPSVTSGAVPLRKSSRRLDCRPMPCAHDVEGQARADAQRAADEARRDRQARAIWAEAVPVHGTLPRLTCAIAASPAPCRIPCGFRPGAGTRPPCACRCWCARGWL